METNNLNTELENADKDYSFDIRFHALPAIFSDKIREIPDVIAQAKKMKFNPEIIDIQSFIDNYLDELKPEGLLKYLQSRYEDEISAFCALIDFMHAGLKLEMIDMAPYSIVECDHLLFFNFNIRIEENKYKDYELKIVPPIANLVKEYNNGNITIQFTAKELLTDLADRCDN